MRSLMRLSIVVWVAAFAVIAAGSDASEIVGVWKMTFGPEGDKRQARLILEEKDGELTGTWSSRRGGHELIDIKYDDGKLSFKIDFDTRGYGKREMDYKGALEGGVLNGKLTTPRSSQAVTGVRWDPKQDPSK